jgi:hypothetical protein
VPTPFIGTWNFNVDTPVGQRGASVVVTDTDGVCDVWHQPTGGHFVHVSGAQSAGAHLTFTSPGSASRPSAVWRLEARGDVLTGTQQRADGVTTPLLGRRAPVLNREMPRAWTARQWLFNGSDLDGWEPLGVPNLWTAGDGLLVNNAKGSNLRSTRTFDDFVLHFEVKGEDGANSGFYLRGRYELQIEFEPVTKNPPERRMGSIYGRIEPVPELPRRPGEWHAFDVTLVGRIVTIVHDDVTVVDRQVIEGITGGALDADEAAAGPFVIQGDHTGGLMFRNITVAVPEWSTSR